MPKYLDSEGVSYLWSKIKNIFLTEEETKTYINNHIIVSSTEPVGQSENDIWMLISDFPSNVDNNGDQLSNGVKEKTDE